MHAWFQGWPVVAAGDHQLHRLERPVRLPLEGAVSQIEAAFGVLEGWSGSGATGIVRRPRRAKSIC